MTNLRYDIQPVEQLRAEIEQVAASWGQAPGTTFQSVDCNGVSAEWISVASPGGVGDAVYLHAHGGGYYRGSSQVDAPLCSFLCADAGVRCLSVNYRRPPDEGVFPAALDDLYTAWRWLIRPDGGGVSPAQVVVGGSSAGGGLGLALLLRIRDAGEERPAGALAVSPWTDLTQSGASFLTNAAHGPAREYLAHWGQIYLAGVDPRHPYASPLFADLRDLPPLLLQAGGQETMLDDATAFAAAAARAGNSVALEVYAGQPHSFQHEAATSPVAREAVQRLAAFVSRRTGGDPHGGGGGSAHDSRKSPEKPGQSVEVPGTERLPTGSRVTAISPLPVDTRRACRG